MRSEVLGLVAYVAKQTPPLAPGSTWALAMRWHDPATGADIPDLSQSRIEARAQRIRADAERDRADAAERQIAELEGRLRRRDES